MIVVVVVVVVAVPAVVVVVVTIVAAGCHIAAVKVNPNKFTAICIILSFYSKLMGLTRASGYPLPFKV